MNDVELQRDITRTALTALRGTEFALAGSGAIREHGVTSRLTADVDLFSPPIDPAGFGRAVDDVTTALTRAGYQVTMDDTRRSDQFARFDVVTAAGEHVDVDMAIDSRDAEPVTLSVGPVLSIDDAVHNKVSASTGGLPRVTTSTSTRSAHPVGTPTSSS